MNRLMKLILLGGVILFAFGCGYKAYLGMHGTSVRLHPDIHKSVIKDSECLECHNPDNPKGPPTPHPNFTGCIKCHDDDNGTQK
jgi:hypothetical protein